MTTFKWIPILLAGMTLACDAYADEPISATPVDSGVGSQIKFIDPVTGNTRQPTAAEVASLRARAATMNSAPGLSMLPKTRAEAARSITVANDGTETMMASQDSFNTLVQTRQPDGSLVTVHGGADGRVEAAAKEQASE